MRAHVKDPRSGWGDVSSHLELDSRLENCRIDLMGLIRANSAPSPSGGLRRGKGGHTPGFEST